MEKWRELEGGGGDGAQRWSLTFAWQEQGESKLYQQISKGRVEVGERELSIIVYLSSIQHDTLNPP